MGDLTELNKLEDYLKERGIKYERFDNNFCPNCGARMDERREDE